MKPFDRDMEDVLACLGDALKDPRRPKHCAQFYIDSFFALNETDYEHALRERPQSGGVLWRNTLHRRAGRHKHAFLDICWAFLATLRSLEDIDAMMAAMELCQCHMYQWPSRWEWIHAPRRGRSGSFSEALLQIVCFVTEVLTWAPDDYSKSRRRADRAAQRGSFVPWPEHARTLLGTDADTTITALCRWMTVCPSHEHFKLLYELARICGRPAVIPMFRCVHLPRLLMDELEKGLALLPRRLEALPPMFATLRWFRTALAHPDGMSTAAFYGSECERGLRLVDRMLGIWPWVRRVPESQHTDEEKANWVFFMRDAGWVHSALGLPYDEAQYRREVLDCSRDAQSLRAQSNVYHCVHDEMMRQCKMDYCGFPPCMATFTSEGRPFRYCGGCKRVPYCSVACQRKHWRWERSAHRNLCDDFRYLRDILEYPAALGKRDMEQPFSKEDAEVLCHVKKVDLAAIQNVAPYYQEYNKRILKEIYGGSADATSYLNKLA
ncbi:hypothetical protein BD626DRAFT_50565 [Schizophyllum amplum]|uniref:MYND-type domain-containing protein n=1 Tax=Schizophyllum amplum TaxID=97359 RepID=A0A550CCJ1_9AGAR|nr:hypothetical protein BD626DRAFT_50565 [Auriculariopsis ampla]